MVGAEAEVETAGVLDVDAVLRSAVDPGAAAGPVRARAVVDPFDGDDLVGGWGGGGGGERADGEKERAEEEKEGEGVEDGGDEGLGW